MSGKFDSSVCKSGSELAKLVGTNSDLSKAFATLKEPGSGFQTIAADTPLNLSYLQGAMGISVNPFTDNIPSFPDSQIFYKFWTNEDSSNSFLIIINGYFSSAGSTVLSKMPGVNDLYYCLLWYLFCTLYQNNYNIIDTNSPAIGALNNWRNVLYNSRGAGTLFVSTLCQYGYFSNKKGVILRQYLSKDNTLDGWCGCCLPDNNPYITTSKFPRECEPLCNNSMTIPYFYGDITLVNVPDNNTPPSDEYMKAECNNTVCVIDNVTIEALSSKGTINFSQVCPGCAKAENAGKCTCINIGTGNLDKIGTGKEGMQNPAIFKQFCPNSLCFKKDDNNGTLTQVKCNSGNPANTGKNPENGYNGNGIFGAPEEVDVYGINTWFFPVFIFAFFILFFIGAIFITSYNNKIISSPHHKFKGKKLSDKQRDKILVNQFFS